MDHDLNYLDQLRYFLNLQIEAQLNQDWKTYQELEETIKKLENNT